MRLVSIRTLKVNLRLLEQFIQRGRLTVIDHHDQERVFGAGEPTAAWRLNRPSTFMRILRNPQLNLGETYMDGEWDVAQGTLHDLLTILRTSLEPNISRNRWLDPLWAVLRSWNGLAASRTATCFPSTRAVPVPSTERGAVRPSTERVSTQNRLPAGAEPSSSVLSKVSVSDVPVTRAASSSGRAVPAAAVTVRSKLPTALPSVSRRPAPSDAALAAW